MSEAELPRVKISEKPGSWSMKFNFSQVGYSNPNLDSVTKELFDLCQDWTDYCIASLKFSPPMYLFGNHIVNEDVKIGVLDFLKSVSVSGETVAGDTDGEVEHSFVVHDDDLAVVSRKIETTTQMIKAAESVMRANLGSIVSEFEFFIARFLRIVAKNRYDLFISGNETIPIGSLSDYETIDQIIQKKAQEKIDDKLRGSHDDVITWLSETLSITDVGSIRSSDEYVDFMEVCQRRHVLTHNGGIVNAEYIRKCTEAGLKTKDLPKLGEKIKFGPKYLKRSTARAFLLGLYLVQLYVQKLGEEEKSASQSILLSISHDFLEVRLTKMSQRVIKFATHRSANLSHKNKLSFAINDALCRLMDPKKTTSQQSDSANEILANYDWSVTGPIFDLALACVRRDFSDLIPLAKAANADGLRYSEAATYCVFWEAREQDGFMDCFPRKLLMIADK